MPRRNREGFTECSDCGTRLVAGLPPDQAPEPDAGPVLQPEPDRHVDLATILLTRDPLKFSLAMNALGQAGIEFGSPRGAHPSSFIQVRLEDEDRARELLRDLLGDA